MPRPFAAAHSDLPRSAGVAAQLASDAYVESLARVAYYWAYPAVDTYGRTHLMWTLAKDGPGSMLGILPGAPVNTSGCLADYMSPRQRWVVTPNNDTIYGVGFTNLALEPAVIQTPLDVPNGRYWTIQIVDVFTNVIHQLGSAAGTPGGKYLLVGPDWEGEAPEEFLGVLRVPTNVAVMIPRAFAARSPESRAAALHILSQACMYPLSQNQPGTRSIDPEAIAANSLFPPGITAEMIAADPDASRPQWVKPEAFWQDLEEMLDANPAVGPDDRAMAEQARRLIALHHSDASYAALLDRSALEADVALQVGSRYTQVGHDVGNGWQFQEGAGLWGSDWFNRAQAAAIYIFVNSYKEAMYLIRGTDSAGQLLNGKYSYTMTFGKDGLPPVDRERGGFWSLTMYDKDYFMLPDAPDGRTNLGSAYLDAGLIRFEADGSLVVHLSAAEPTEETARANWLPAPKDEFALILRAYVPGPELLDHSYQFPNVERSPARP